MKKHLLLALLLVLCACTEENWVIYPVDQHITVQLPAKPHKLDLKQMGLEKKLKLKYKSLDKFSGLGATDDYGLYGIVINAAAPITSTRLIGRDSLYNMGIKTVLRANPGSRLLKRASFITPVGNGIEVVVSLRTKESKERVLIFNRTLLVGDKSYSFTYSPKAGQDSIAGNVQRRRFFDSITVKP